MLLAYIIISIVSTVALIFVMRHPKPPLVPPKGNGVAVHRIHKPHLPHPRRPRHDN